MVDVWLEALEDNEISAVVLLDMSAAFDVVDRSLLLAKLHLYWFDCRMLSWTESYLSLTVVSFEAELRQFV